MNMFLLVLLSAIAPAKAWSSCWGNGCKQGGAPAPSYGGGAPAPSYGAPAPSYGAPAPSSGGGGGKCKKPIGWKCNKNWYIGSTAGDDFAKDSTMWGNVHRCMHDAEFIKWDSTMAAATMNYIRGKGSNPPHSPVSTRKDQGEGFFHEEIILVCAPNQTQRALLSAPPLDVETLGNVQGTFALKAGPCEAQSTDCTSKLGLGAQVLLGGNGEIVWRSVPPSCCTPLNTFLRDIWAPGAVDLMCNECKVTKNAAIQTFYLEGFPCYVPPHVV